MTRIGVIGEALVDIVHRPDGTVLTAPGGSPANVALTIGRLGLDVRLVTSLGDDDAGRAVRAWLQASHVEVAATTVGRTSRAVAHLDATGAATYEFDLAWELMPVVIEGLDVLHVGSVAALIDPGAKELITAVRAARSHAVITYDPNMRPALLRDAALHRRRVEQIVELSDVVKASDEDLLWLYPDVDPLVTAATWQRQGPALVVVTRGGAGADAVTAGHTLHTSAPVVEVADTVGAGDTFMGTLIAGLVEASEVGPSRQALHEMSSATLQAMMDASARAAASTVSRAGADPPWGDGVARRPVG